MPIQVQRVGKKADLRKTLMAERFFSEVASAPFLQNTAKDSPLSRLVNMGCEVMSAEEANELRHGQLFDTLLSSQGNKWSLCEALPLIPCGEWIHLPFPYDAVEHEDHQIENIPISEMISHQVNANFSKNKFIFSANPSNPIALRFVRFSYEIFEELHSENLVTPFVLFDVNFDRCLLINFDLCISILSFRVGVFDTVSGIGFEKILEYFNNHFIDGAEGGQHHLDVVNANYVPRIEGVKELALPKTMIL